MLTPRKVRIITACAVAFAIGSLVAATVKDVRGEGNASSGPPGVPPTAAGTYGVGKALSQAEKDAFTVAQVLDITSGLSQLSNYDTVDKDGKPAKGYYKFSSDLRWTIALNIDLGRRAQTQLQNESNELVMKYSAGTGTVPEDKRGAYGAEVVKLMAAQSRVGFYHLKREDLKLDENPIPAPVLSLILPIIDR